MKINLILNEKDIRDIIAQHFDVKPESVLVSAHEGTEGYGTNEHKYLYVDAIVKAEKEAIKRD